MPALAWILLPLLGAVATPPGGEQLSIAEIARNYESYLKITPEPVWVDAELSRLCRGLTQADIDAARRRGAKQANAGVLIYMNQLAAKSLAGAATKYPVGAVVVKRKSEADDGQAGHKVIHRDTGVGGMVKRAPGYDPDHGDWEYFYFEDPKKIESGRIESCVKCHRAAKDRDFVFGNWRKHARPDLR